ncbi:S-adenosyl-L-methionine-dependent methyltransferase [Filobasidium floriforme]|uniref:S-adenosyl-L-methionine-dependent methyltransferase n=1 Tax=Filobasidium floriforme TaxID=5210 RepID=UPI001E8E9F03|nr:S-adenosyl-L-methionine-dependent methyltransferase [Filobasidium floriforme]KAH8083185.1 S-adenosyl-L-methionine-dependent methyltransferase [Filobasidium floriforme]
MNRGKPLLVAALNHSRRDAIQRRFIWHNPASWFTSAQSDSATDSPLAIRPNTTGPTAPPFEDSHLSRSTPIAAATPPTPTPTITPTFNSINASEISHFSRLSSQWWDEKGEFGLLHKMNPVRMEFVRKKVISAREDDDGWSFATRKEARKDFGQSWLEGMDVLDVGCGGGLLSESLARVGGNTLGIDASASNIAIASLHASRDPFLPFIADEGGLEVANPPASAASRRGTLRYRHTSAEQLHAEGRKFDLVCSMEVLEHVDQPGEFLKVLGDMVKPGGHLALSTINRTPLSQLLTITMAEHVLRLVTPGTHTYDKFIKPSELLAFVRDHMGGESVWESDGDGLIDGGRDGGGVGVGEVRGIVYDPIAGNWKLWKDGAPGGTLCNYMFHMRKRADAV